MTPRSLALCLVLAALAAPALAADPCAGVDIRLSEARRQAYAPLVAGALTPAIAPSKVAVRRYLSAGAWVIVSAETPLADGEGFFFFRRDGGKLRYVTVWAGFTVEEEAAENIAWARGVGVPAGLAACFAHAAAAN